MYGISKVAEIAYTNIVAREESSRGSGVLVNAMCPGYCSTNMSSYRGVRSAEKGAETAVFLATTPRDELALKAGPGAVITGRFYYDCEPLVEFEGHWV
jgi:NAD(P)-dependent dehydrogenase (short-subunit alcohol dehydrogenase family)